MRIIVAMTGALAALFVPAKLGCIPEIVPDSQLARARCRMLAERIEEVLPGVCDTRSAEEGGNPRFWTGLRPKTPDSTPIVGRTPLDNLYLNTGHGTLGWTMSCGSGHLLADIVSGHETAIRSDDLSVARYQPGHALATGAVPPLAHSHR